MKTWIKILLILLTLQGVASATPRDDFFTSLDSTTAYSKAVDDFTYKTQALRLLDLISAGSGGGGGGVVTQPTGSNLHTVVDSGTLVCTQPTGTNLHTVVDSGTITAVTSITNPVAVTAAALPLPAGAATVAKQPALGTAGTASTDVISVQGIAAMTPLLVNGSGVTQPVSGTVTATPSADQTATGTITANGQAITLSGLIDAGAIGVVSSSGTATLISEGSIDGSTWFTLQGTTATSLGAATSSILASSNYVFPGAGLAAFRVRATAFTSNITISINATSTPYSVATILGPLPTGTNSIGNIGTVGTTTPGTAATNLGKAEDAASASNNVGVMALGVRRDAPVANGNTDTDADYIPFSTDNFGRVWTAAVVTPVVDQGLTQHSAISTAAAVATNVKASAGNVYNIEVFNTTATVAYLKLYNSASAPTAGSGTPVKRLMIPANGGLVLNSAPGIQFATGIGYTITGLPADNDTTAVAANQVLVNLDYK